MTIKLLLALLFFPLFSCQESTDKTKDKTADKTTEHLAEATIDQKITYEACLQENEQKRLNFKKKYALGNLKKKEEILDSVSLYLTNTLTKKILPYWYGTTWDFNGHTTIPNQGEIACGYLVSTTLKHAGFQLNRYKFAQQSATNEAKTLQPSSPLLIYRNKTVQEMIERIKTNLSEGLYILGLDNHVGYLLVEQHQVYFIHSNYCTNTVEREKAEKSPCFNSNVYVIGELSTNRELLKKWILGKNIPIVLD